MSYYSRFIKHRQNSCHFKISFPRVPPWQLHQPIKVHNSSFRHISFYSVFLSSSTGCLFQLFTVYHKSRHSTRHIFEFRIFFITSIFAFRIFELLVPFGQEWMFGLLWGHKTEYWIFEKQWRFAVAALAKGREWRDFCLISYRNFLSCPPFVLPSPKSCIERVRFAYLSRYSWKKYFECNIRNIIIVLWYLQESWKLNIA